MDDYEVTWDGTRRFGGGMLVCKPELPAKDLGVDVEERSRYRENARKGSFVKKAYDLLAEKPRTLLDLAAAAGWTPDTATNALYELRRAMGQDAVKWESLPGRGKGRPPRLYWVP